MTPKKTTKLTYIFVRLLLSVAEQQTSFTQHFCYDEDDDGSEKTSTSQEIDQGIPSGGKQMWQYD
jgi:hypothetical protein